MLSSAGGPKRLVPEGAMFDVLWDEHVVAGGHCKGRTFDARVKAKYVGIPRCLNPAPSHHTRPHPILLDSPLPIPLPSHSHLSPIPLLSHPTPMTSRWVLVAFVACCGQCTRRVSCKPKSLAGSHPIVVRGFNTRGQVHSVVYHEMLRKSCELGPVVK